MNEKSVTIIIITPIQILRRCDVIMQQMTSVAEAERRAIEKITFVNCIFKAIIIFSHFKVT